MWLHANLVYILCARLYNNRLQLTDPDEGPDRRTYLAPELCKRVGMTDSQFKDQVRGYRQS